MKEKELDAVSHRIIDSNGNTISRASNCERLSTNTGDVRNLAGFRVARAQLLGLLITDSVELVCNLGKGWRHVFFITEVNNFNPFYMTDKLRTNNVLLK